MPFSYHSTQMKHFGRLLPESTRSAYAGVVDVAFGTTKAWRKWQINENNEEKSWSNEGNDEIQKACHCWHETWAV